MAAPTEAPFVELLEAPLFPELDEAALRTAITRSCKATGTPHFSPHGLRRRSGSLHYKRTGSLADVAELGRHPRGDTAGGDGPRCRRRR